MNPPATPGTYPYPNEPTWSRSEKAIARTVFDAALKRELQKVMQKANRLREPADVWELEHFLTQPRKDIDRRYEFRSSWLTQVFGTLLYEGRISEEELRGIGKDSLRSSTSVARFSRSALPPRC
jgi:hypothetical protein